MNVFKTGLAVFFTLSTLNSAIAQDTIHWRPDYKLKWDDFQGTPDSTSKYQAISTPTLSYTLAYDEKGLTCSIYCFFKKKKSWVIKKNSFLLIHEQGHFNIAEIFAREFRKRITQYRFNYSSVENDVEKIFQQIVQEKRYYDLLYDNETNLSRNNSAQLDWSKKIEIQLKQLDAFKAQLTLP
ncbi:MAG: DUF922 domain-containing protein [Chitinophagaceae bacterium]